MEHRESGAPDAQSNEQRVIKIDAASTAASATSGQSDETKAVSDSALPQYGSDMDAGRPAKRPGLLGKLRDSLISGWYTPGERMSQDRACLVISNYTTNIVANLIGGSFYTGLLLLMDADDNFIGTMSMIGVAANMAQMFAPLLLERFTQRKKLLMTVRAITMVINILVVGLIPLAPVPHQAQLTMLGICVAVVNFAGSLISPGLSIWHIQSVPPRVRTSYFSLVTMTVGPIVAICNLGGSAIVDMFKARGNEYGGLMALRIIALALYVVDFCMYAHIKEYPYENAGSKFTLRDLFTLLKNMNLSYTYITAANLINVPVVLLLTPVWGRFMKGRSPFRVLWIGMLLYVVYYIGLAFVTENSLILYPIMLVWGFVMVIGINLPFASIPYINMPKEHQTVFMGFYYAVANFAALIGVTIGKYFVGATENVTIEFMGCPMVNKQYLLLLTGALIAGAAFLVRRIERTTPYEDD